MTGAKSAKKKKNKGHPNRSSEKNAHEDVAGPSEEPTSQGQDTPLKQKINPEALIKQAHLLKDHGNQQFADSRVSDALYTYDVALRFLPEGHKDRAIIHCNRAACYLQIRPVRYDLVLEECEKAIAIQPEHIRALLRKAEANIALKKFDDAIADLNLCLKISPDNKDAVELLQKFQTAQGKPSQLRNVELDDWYISLAEIIQQKLGFDPLLSDISKYEMETISLAIEETMSVEEAVPLFQEAEKKFKNMSSYVFLNWGKIHQVLANLGNLKEDKENVEGKNTSGKVDSNNEEVGSDLIKREQKSGVKSPILPSQLSECEWTLKHLDSAIGKFSEALRVEPEFMDAIFGRACSFSSQARALEIKSTLQFLSGEKIGKSDLELIKKSYENSISDFTAANGLVEIAEKETEAHVSSCNHPEHSHDDISSSRKLIALNHVEALAHFAHFEYKIGEDKWKNSLRNAQEIEESIKETGFFKGDFLKSIPKEMQDFLSPSSSVEIENSREKSEGKKHQWEHFWKPVKMTQPKPIPRTVRESGNKKVFHQTTEVPDINVDLKKKIGPKAHATNQLLSETDEPMTPVADLIGKFQNLSSKGH